MNCILNTVGFYFERGLFILSFRIAFTLIVVLWNPFFIDRQIAFQNAMLFTQEVVRHAGI